MSPWLAPSLVLPIWFAKLRAAVIFSGDQKLAQTKTEEPSFVDLLMRCADSRGEV